MNKSNPQLIEAVKSLPVVAERERWVLTLDKEENALYFSPEKIPDGAELYQVTDEYALYLDRDMKPKGIMIEYFGQNFIKHHSEFKELGEKLFGGKEITTTIDPKANGTKKEVKFFKALLIDTLISETTNLMPA